MNSTDQDKKGLEPGAGSMALAIVCRGPCSHWRIKEYLFIVIYEKKIQESKH